MHSTHLFLSLPRHLYQMICSSELQPILIICSTHVICFFFILLAELQFCISYSLFLILISITFSLLLRTAFPLPELFVDNSFSVEETKQHSLTLLFTCHTFLGMRQTKMDSSTETAAVGLGVLSINPSFVSSNNLKKKTWVISSHFLKISMWWCFTLSFSSCRTNYAAICLMLSLLGKKLWHLPVYSPTMLQIL